MMFLHPSSQEVLDGDDLRRVLESMVACQQGFLPMLGVLVPSRSKSLHRSYDSFDWANIGKGCSAMICLRRGQETRFQKKRQGPIYSKRFNPIRNSRSHVFLGLIG